VARPLAAETWAAEAWAAETWATETWDAEALAAKAFADEASDTTSLLAGQRSKASQFGVEVLLTLNSLAKV
jgi:hypothetical protein